MLFMCCCFYFGTDCVCLLPDFGLAMGVCSVLWFDSLLLYGYLICAWSLLLFIGLFIAREW